MRVFLLTLWLLSINSYAVETTTSLSLNDLGGIQNIEESVSQPQLYKWAPDSSPLPRDYVQQPPLIPHQIESYQITLKFNKCLTCHSFQNSKQSGATKISITHFRDRDGVELDNVAPRRYFCTQCHVPQTDAKPLVENVFKPVEALQ
ncbi:nitrate reductase cytochrome c-type subunit [Beggiatoa alba B18LD]|uniref:Periplasmic nitrate reductase, electron transfer subunit n=1 Tax=Beggiatoa alba B18LD TaxID=395493 RepID=I3CHX8_9GAMM|nr:nitrate reductase cytochrome c-type subunit [Beggiatoa alba]EIJ43221.1 nitrate reductase cytochrome c-type subunit [Beggiatoa alba B18LD]